MFVDKCCSGVVGKGLETPNCWNESLGRETCRDFLHQLLSHGLSNRQGEQKKAEPCTLKMLLRINCFDWHSWVRLNEWKVNYKVMLLVPYGIKAKLNLHTNVWPQYINFSNSAAHDRPLFRNDQPRKNINCIFKKINSILIKLKETSKTTYLLYMSTNLLMFSPSMSYPFHSDQP